MFPDEFKVFGVGLCYFVGNKVFELKTDGDFRDRTRKDPANLGVNLLSPFLCLTYFTYTLSSVYMILWSAASSNFDCTIS